MLHQEDQIWTCMYSAYMPPSSCMSKVYLKQSRNRLPCRHILLGDTEFIGMNSFPSLCLLDSLCQLCTHSKRQQTRGLFRSCKWPEKTQLIRRLSGHLNWTEAEFSSTTVGRVFNWHPNVPECFVCFTKVHLCTEQSDMKHALICMLCSLGVVIRTEDPVNAAIMAVHTICGALMSGGLAEGGGSQSVTDLSLSLAYKRFNKKTCAGVFVGINQFLSCTGKTQEVCSPPTHVFHFFEWCL